MKRRTVLIGFGTVVAASGAALGTGAFTTVETERSVSVRVTEDSQALVGIDVNDRYGGQNEDGVAEFDLQSTLFNNGNTGFNPDGKTVLYAALAITNNSGIEGDDMTLQLAYESSSVDVPAGQVVPETDHEGQFYFRPFDSTNIPSDADVFDGLAFEGSAEDIVTPGSISQGETTVLDLVVDPGGKLKQNQDYAVAVTIVANISSVS
jgi:hypothetical protein